MDYKLTKGTIKDKETLWNLLQLALYDGSFYTGLKPNKNGVFEYSWFDNYFTDSDRDIFLIKTLNEKIIGFVMINENVKINHDKGQKTIAEFLVLPPYRRLKIGKQVAFEIFDMYQVEWEVQPMENNKGAYLFWKKIINEYSKSNFNIVPVVNEEDVFVFKSNKILERK